MENKLVQVQSTAFTVWKTDILRPGIEGSANDRNKRGGALSLIPGHAQPSYTAWGGAWVVGSWGEFPEAGHLSCASKE